MAVSANELRIGNYVLDQKGRIKNVWCIKQDSIQTSDYDIYESEINPIPLTPDMLFNNLGFIGKYKSCGYVFSKNGVTLTSQDEDDEGNPIDNYVFHVHLNHAYEGIYYLHQLQNLFFALTNTELTYNPK